MSQSPSQRTKRAVTQVRKSCSQGDTTPSTPPSPPLFFNEHNIFDELESNVQINDQNESQNTTQSQNTRASEKKRTNESKAREYFGDLIDPENEERACTII
jgi:hypothetical protein